MRGLLVCPISADYPGNKGILNKMAYQQAALGELAGSMDVVCNSVRGPLFCGERIADYAITGRPFNTLNHYINFYRHVWKQCRPADYDFLYVRYPLALPSFLRLLRATKDASPQTKIVVEVPTFPYRDELRGPKQRVLLAFDDLGYRRLKDYVDVIVTFFGQSEIFGIPCIQSANGIDVRSIPVAPGRPVGDGVALIVVANLARWHGVDRLLRGLSSYLESGGSRPVTLDIVGDGPSAAELTALTRTLGVESAVRFHGMRSGEELDALYGSADLAISSLGMHRLGLRRSSSLKAREYCARGIPFVLASEDPDFPDGFPFAHHVAADDSPLDVTALVGFVDELRNRHPDYMMGMRQYAEERLTWRAKLEPVVRYVRTGELVDAT